MVSEHASPLAVLGGEDAGGQNVHVAALSGALAARGHQVEVYTRRDDPELPERVALHHGVVVVHVPAGPQRALPKDALAEHMPAFGRWLAHRWQHDTPDLVHTHFWMSGVAGLVARDVVPVPTVHTFHALGSVKRRYQGAADTSPPDRIDVEAALARAMDAVIATCTDEVNELLALGAPAEALHVVPCGVDVHQFTPHGHGQPRSDRPRLVCAGRLVERKGVATAIAALTHTPRVELVVAGGPAAAELHTDPSSRRLLDLAEELAVADRVRLLGRLDHVALPPLLRSADAVVAVPWYEPFGIVPLEAMACGVPVIASAVGGMLDTVIDGVTGVRVPPNDPDALAAAVLRLLAEPRRRAAMGRAGARRAARRYAWERVAADTETIYRRVLYGTAPRRSARVSLPAIQGVAG